MLTPSLQKNDSKAKMIILVVSLVVFATVTVLGKYNLSGKVNLPFDVHIFAAANGIINAAVSILLLIGLITVKNKNFELHKKIMMFAMILSILFLVSYICHHLFAGAALTHNQDVCIGLRNHPDGLVDVLHLLAVADHPLREITS